MRGRKPKLLERHISEGDPRKFGKNKLQQRCAAVPKAASGFTACPKQLAGRGRATWKFWSEELQAMNLDKRPDGPMLEGACRAYERAVEADLILAREGLIVEDKIVTEEGDVVVLRVRKHPAVDISNRSWLMVKAFCTEFGLTPVSRTRLAIENKPDQTDDLMQLLSQPRHRHLAVQ